MPAPLHDCPVCASSDRRSTGPAAPGFRAHAQNAAFEQPAYRILECSRCGLLYRDRTLSSDEFARYYAATDFAGWETSGYYPTETAVLSILQILPRGSRILDFGCSSGRLLASLVAEHECFGFEINAAAAAAATTKGLRMLSDEEITAETTEPFDAILLMDVFEHLADPLSVLRRLARKLSPRGRLIVVTGNGDAAACRRDPAQFWYFRIIEHVAMLTRRSAEFIAAELGGRLSEWQTLSHYRLTRRERLIQRLQDFAFWQFRRRTLLARTFLRFVPLLRRARHAAIAPTCNCSADHVLAVFTFVVRPNMCGRE